MIKTTIMWLYNISIFCGIALLLDTTIKYIEFINSHQFTKFEQIVMYIVLTTVYSSISLKLIIKESEK